MNADMIDEDTSSDGDGAIVGDGNVFVDEDADTGGDISGDSRSDHDGILDSLTSINIPSGIGAEVTATQLEVEVMGTFVDEAVWNLTNQRSGGVCEECQHNTMGNQCQKCKEGYYHDPDKKLTDINMCVPCSCDPAGSLFGGICDPATNPDEKTVAGQCHCKKNVMGDRCDTPKPGTVSEII